jgi:hypothetical protein
MQLFGYIDQFSENRNMGDRFAVNCRFKPVGTTISGFDALLNATFDAWDQNGNQIVTAFPVAMIETQGKQWCRIRYVMQTGAGKTISTPGTYTYQFTVNLSDGTTQIFQQVALINPTP